MFHAPLVPSTNRPYVATALLPAGVFRYWPTNAVGYDSATIVIINRPLPNMSKPSIRSTRAKRAWWKHVCLSERSSVDPEGFRALGGEVTTS